MLVNYLQLVTGSIKQLIPAKRRVFSCLTVETDTVLLFVSSFFVSRCAPAGAVSARTRRGSAPVSGFMVTPRSGAGSKRSRSVVESAQGRRERRPERALELGFCRGV